MLEQPRPHVRNDTSRQPRIPTLVPDRNDRGDDAGGREDAEDLVQRLKILFAERVVDQEFQAQRHDDVEQGLDHDAEADEQHQPLVVGQERLDKTVDRGERAGGFLGGEDDEVLVIIIVVKLKLVVVIFFVIAGWRAGRLRPICRDNRGGTGRSSPGRELLRELRIVRRRGILIIRRRRLWRHETNRCCTAGMTANRTR